MLLRGPDRLLGHRKTAVGKRAHRHPHKVWKTIGFPPEIRTAFRAEMKRHVEPAGGMAAKAFRVAPQYLHTGLWIKGCNAEQRAGPSLAVETVTERYLRRLTAAAERKLPAMAAGFPDHATRLNVCHQFRKDDGNGSPGISNRDTTRPKRA